MGWVGRAEVAWYLPGSDPATDAPAKKDLTLQFMALLCMVQHIGKDHKD